MRPRVGAPGVVRRMLKWNGPDVEPRSVGDASIIHIRHDDAGDIVDYFLLDRERRSGAVVVTRTTKRSFIVVCPLPSL